MRQNPIFRTLLFMLALLVTAGYAHRSLAIDQQRGRNWCWAACIQDVLRDGGVFDSQVNIAARLDGWPQDRPASTAEIVALLGTYGCRSWIVDRPPVNDNELYGSLQQGFRFIALIYPQGGPVGHFVVISGFDRDGNLFVEDPADGKTRKYHPAFMTRNLKWRQTVCVTPPR